MQYYLELTLINSLEIKTYELWSKLYTQLHLAFVEVKDQNDKIKIGVSFPEYRYNYENGIGFLGTKLRLFSTSEESLKKLKINQWVDQLIDYLHISSIRLVPQDKVIAYVCFYRKQCKTNAERLARHRIKTRNDIDFNEAVRLYQNRITSTDLPFIQMKSLSNAQPFKLFIEKKNSEMANVGEFNTYGLSSKSTVPDF